MLCMSTRMRIKSSESDYIYFVECGFRTRSHPMRFFRQPFVYRIWEFQFSFPVWHEKHKVFFLRLTPRHVRWLYVLRGTHGCRRFAVLTCFRTTLLNTKSSIPRAIMRAFRGNATTGHIWWLWTLVPTTWQHFKDINSTYATDCRLGYMAYHARPFKWALKEIERSTWSNALSGFTRSVLAVLWPAFRMEDSFDHFIVTIHNSSNRSDRGPTADTL